MFSISLSDADRGLYSRFRIRATRHPNELPEYLCLRVLAYCHAYEEGLEFSQGFYEPKQPTIWKKDVLGRVVFWAQVGVPERRKLQKALREDACIGRLIYFYDPLHFDQFCHECLKGSTSNWVDDLQFYTIDTGFVETAVSRLGSRSEWEVTIVDSSVYLVIDGIETATTVERLNVWQRYQESIGNT